MIFFFFPFSSLELLMASFPKDVHFFFFFFFYSYPEGSLSLSLPPNFLGVLSVSTFGKGVFAGRIRTGREMEFLLWLSGNESD